MEQLIIDGRLPGLNEFIAAERSNRYKGASMKRDAQRFVAYAIRAQMRGVRYTRPIRLHYIFFEPNKKRDHDNVSGFAHKVIQDALVECSVINDDGWDEIIGYSDDFIIDRKNPRIVVEIEEVI